jgi:hypothetical protein
VSLLVVDGEAVREFMDKAEPLLDDRAAARLDQALSRRTALVRGGTPADDLPWARRWDLAPASRRVPADQRPAWERRLAPLYTLAVAGEAERLVDGLEEMGDPPAWVLDWTTYWLGIADPRWPWWARWVYRRDGGAGALPLVTGNAQAIRGEGIRATYAAIGEGVRFLAEVLASTRRLRAVSDENRPLVALASVYAVYMFTMAAWKLSDEFTKVFPPFSVVVETLLGLKRWEASRSG